MAFSRMFKLSWQVSSIEATYIVAYPYPLFFIFLF